jgi:tetratricopeptide (TPR) repeat protein
VSRLRAFGTALALGAAALACASPEIEPRYRPSASALEIIAVLERHVSDDTYRFEPARDFTDRNVYRSSLLRLENLEQLHADALRAGHLDGAIAFAKGRALERLRAYDLAADAYHLAAEREPTLHDEALRSADLLDTLHEVVSSPSPLAPAVASGEHLGELALPDVDAALARFEERAAKLEELAHAAEGTHHAYVIAEEIERADLERARYFTRLRDVLPDGDVRAVSELERVALRHGDSKRAARHLLALADLYADLSIDYVEDHPPEGLLFDPGAFRDLVDSGSRVYEMVASRDGVPEKLEAARRLEAFLAFALSVDRDRFTP